VSEPDGAAVGAEVATGPEVEGKAQAASKLSTTASVIPSDKSFKPLFGYMLLSLLVMILKSAFWTVKSIGTKIASGLA
jgi:hypothetical protein